LYAISTKDVNRFKGYKSGGKVYASDPDVAQNGVGHELCRTRRAPNVSLARVYTFARGRSKPNNQEWGSGG